MSEYIVGYELIPLKWRDGYGLSDVDLTEEIVRCRDCTWRRDFYWNDGERKHRDGSYCCGYRSGSYVKPDGFCSEGKKKGSCLQKGGTVHESYIHPREEGSTCQIPRASVIFEGQKLTFDAEDSEKFMAIVDEHFRKLAGLEVLANEQSD